MSFPKCRWVMTAALLSLAPTATSGAVPETVPDRLVSAEARLRPGESRRVARAAGLLRSEPGGKRVLAPVFGRPFARPVVLAQSASNESFSQLQQAVSTLADGGFAAVWVTGDYPTRDVWMQWLDSTGQPTFPVGGRLVAGGVADQAAAVVAAHPTAGAYVAFTSDQTILVQYFDAAGAPQWPGTGVVVAQSGPSELLTEPFVLANPGDGVFVCYEYSAPGPTEPSLDIRCQHVDATGALQFGPFGASVGGGDADWRVLPRATADGQGGLLVFWRNQRRAYLGPDDSPMLMEGQRFASDGSPLWGATPLVVRTTRLASDIGYSDTFFQVASDGQGGAVLAFDDWTGTSDPDFDVIAQRVSGAGDLLWGEGAVVTGANGHQQHEQTIAAPDGGAFVAVYEELSGVHNRLRLFRLGPTGAHVWDPAGLLLSDPRATALDYFVKGSFDDGLLRLAWTHETTPSVLDMDVMLAAYTLDGRRRGGLAGIPLTRAVDAQFLMGLAYSPSFGGVFAVWDDRRKGSWSDFDVLGSLMRDSWPLR
jgi:hypothetical protein